MLPVHDGYLIAVDCGGIAYVFFSEPEMKQKFGMH